MPLFIIAALVIALAAIVFALQNPAPVVVNFLAWQTQGSLALVFLVTLAIGVLLGLLVCTPALLRRGWSVSHQKRKVEHALAELQEKDRQIARQRDQIEAVQWQSKEKLALFSLVEPQTGFLTEQSVPQVCTYLFNRMKAQAKDPHFSSLNVLMIHIDRVRSEDKQAELPINGLVLQAVADLLEAKAYPESWLHCDGQRRLTCLTLGLGDQAAADYGELLRSTLSEVPVELANRSRVYLGVSVGGAIADITHPVDHPSQLLQQAEEALIKAQERGGPNRFAWYGLGRDRLLWN